MLRSSRLHFLLLGVIPALNALALLLYGLHLATSGSGGTERAVPLLLVLAAAGGLALCVAVVRRGRDLGWKTWGSLAGLVLSAGLGPLILLYLGYLLFKSGQPGDNAWGPPAPAVTLAVWLWALVALVLPWFVAVMAARLM
ncbi:MAG: DUF805 domain-containing protein [Hylemonella sp.]|uniref:DUF805 domain-containing protein n=1 Tax=Hylemonella sp. TaxID=2066020 RepID=UPI0022BB763F|nr:DUF805 domain-containing protein [Hylemonella sp.]MCZ8253308.1 DUF805 domain-containing protein [Hylemonella sp.]